MTENYQKVLDLSEEKHWGFRFIGNMPMLKEPIQVGEWEFEPYDEDVEMPKKVNQKVGAISNLATVIGIVVGHDHRKSPPALLNPKPPNLLAAPIRKLASDPVHESVSTPKQIPVREILEVALTVVVWLGKIAWWILIGAGYLVVGFMAAVFSLVDPVVIVVLEDGSWIEIARWYE